MTAMGDPYAVLGIPPDAPLAEVRRAYRLLVKRNHPDAGVGSLERFLEIQAAYEALVREAMTGRGRPRAGRADAWRADAWRPEPAWQRNTAGAAGARGTRGARQPGGTATGERARRGRDPRRATLGSTSYDGAGEAAEPAWDGADWYGPVSGTYWTVNPKEYADPRKHGPEYVARARAMRSPDPRGGDKPLPAAAAASSPPTMPPTRQPFLERLIVAARGRLFARPSRLRP